MSPLEALTVVRQRPWSASQVKLGGGRCSHIVQQEGLMLQGRGLWHPVLELINELMVRDTSDTPSRCRDR